MNIESKTKLMTNSEMVLLNLIYLTVYIQTVKNYYNFFLHTHTQNDTLILLLPSKMMEEKRFRFWLSNFILKGTMESSF